MFDTGWLQIFQRIRPDHYDALSLVTVTGAELVVQQLFKFEHNFLVARARTSGTLDGGRVTIVPYAQIDFIAFNRKLSEEEVNDIFGAPFIAAEGPAVAVQTAITAPVAAPIPIAPIPVAMPRPAAPPPPEPIPGPTVPVAEPTSQAKPGQVSKTLLLARLRERLAEKARN